MVQTNLQNGTTEPKISAQCLPKNFIRSFIKCAWFWKKRISVTLPPWGSLAITIPLPPLAVTKKPILATVRIANPWAFIINPAVKINNFIENVLNVWERYPYWSIRVRSHQAKATSRTNGLHCFLCNCSHHTSKKKSLSHSLGVNEA